MSMRLNVLLLTAASMLIASLAVACGRNDDDGAAPTDLPATVAGTATPAPGDLMELTSSAFDDGGAIPIQYTCEGEGVSPPLQIAGVPSDAAALALTLVDTDSQELPHWMVWNIDPSVTDVPEGSVPQGGFEGITGEEGRGYTPVCPFSSEHLYVLTLYALDEPLNLDLTARLDNLDAAMGGHILGQARLSGTYEKIGP